MGVNKCGVGGNLQVVGGISFENKKTGAMDENTKNGGTHKGRMEGQEAEMALFGRDVIYLISDAKLAELEAQGLGRPENKQERIEWFKKYHTKKINRTQPLAMANPSQ
jgi:hypothetical protein